MRYLIDIHHGFGDVLHMMPTINAIKKEDKNAYIAIIVSTGANVDIFSTQGVIDKCIALNYKELIINRLKYVNGFDYGVIAPCIMDQKKSKSMLKLFGCRKIIFEEKNESNEYKHRVIRNIELINQIGINTIDKYPHLVIPEEEKIFAAHEMEGNSSKLKVALCIGGNYEILKKGRQKIKIDIKRWPIGYYHELIGALKQSYSDLELLLIGGKKDSEEFWNYRGETQVLPEDVQDYMGKTTLLQSGALLDLCDFAVGNDTGMIHLAAALEKPTFTIFCSTDPKKIGAYSNNAVYIEEYLPCKYCYLSSKTFECKNRECLTQIKPNTVRLIIDQYINEKLIIKR